MAAAKKNSSLDPGAWYSAREAAPWLEVTEQTVTDYCRDDRIKGKKIGPKRRWHVLGSEIIRKRKEWGLDNRRPD